MNKAKQTKIGGQAVIEGVMMCGQTASALTVRAEDGMILMSTDRIKQHKKIKKIPIIRGIFSFVSSLVIGTDTIIKSSDMVSPDDEKLSKGAYAFAIVLSFVMALGLFFFLPGLFGGFVQDHITQNVLIKNLASGTLRVVIFVVYLALTSLMKDMRRTFCYHGAEHKTINCYESGAELTVQNIKKCSTRHNRCGTTFMFLVMLISILVFAFVDYGLNILIPLSGYARTFSYMGIKLLFLPLVAGVSYEVLFLLAKMDDRNIIGKILRAPGLALQRLTTAEPDEDMIEVALISFMEVLKLDEDENRPTKSYDKVPLKSCKDYLYKILDELNAERTEADWMLCYVLNCRRSEIKQREFIDLNDFKKLKKLAEERKTMPLDYCLGFSSFCGYDIMVNKNVLIPRAETEVLAELAVKTINKSGFKSVLDLCTGSGCISVVLCKETRAKVTAVDISEDALEVAKKNLTGLGATIIRSDLFDATADQKFDMIVSNPPYIVKSEIDSLQREVVCQPRLALDGGEDGLNFYRTIGLRAKNHLNEGGVLAVEVGAGQAGDVAHIFDKNGLSNIKIIKDLCGVDRIVYAQNKKQI